MNDLSISERDDVLSRASLTYAQVKQGRAIAKTFPRLLHNRTSLPRTCSPVRSPATRRKQNNHTWKVFREFAAPVTSAQGGELLAVVVDKLPDALAAVVTSQTTAERSHVLLWLSRRGIASDAQPFGWAEFSQLVREFVHSYDADCRERSVSCFARKKSSISQPHERSLKRQLRPVIEASQLNSDGMLRMMKEEARLLRRSRRGRQADEDDDLASLLLNNSRNAHERLHLHSSMQRRLAAVMQQPVSRSSNSYSTLDGTWTASNSLHTYRSLDSESFVSAHRSVQSTAAMLQLAQAMTSHQRNSTADLIDEKSLADEQKRLQTTNKFKLALRQSKLDCAASKASALARKRALAKAQRQEIDLAVQQARFVHEQEQNSRRNARRVFTLSDFTSSTIELDPELEETYRRAASPVERVQAREMISRAETRAKSRRFLALAASREQKVRRRLQALNGKVRVNTFQGAEYFPVPATVHEPNREPNPDDSLVGQLEEVMWISCGDIVVDPRRSPTQQRRSTAELPRVVVDRTAESPPYTSPLGASRSFSESPR